MVLVFFKALCTLDPKSREDAKWSNRVLIHIMQRKQSFSDTKVWIVQNVHDSGSCTVVLFTTYPWQKGNEKHLKYDIFSVLSVPLWRNRTNRDSHIRNPTVPKVTHYAQEMAFPWHQCNLSRSCSDSLRALYSKSCYTPRPYANIARKRKIELFASLCTKDLEPRWAASWSNCEQSHTYK